MQIKMMLLAALVAAGLGTGCAGTPQADGDAGQAETAAQAQQGRGLCAGERRRQTGSRIKSSCPQAQTVGAPAAEDAVGSDGSR